MKLKQVFLIVFTLLFAFSLSAECFAQKKRPATSRKPVTSQKGSLSVEAGIVFTSGDIKPAARVDLFLLDADVETILSDTYGESASLKSITLDLNYPIFETNGVQKALAAIKPHIVASATTDFQGKAKFPSVKAGSYYLFGFTKAGKSAVVWNYGITIKSGTNSIILDNKNAALISDN